MRSYLSTSASPDFPLPKKVTTCIFSFHVWKCRDLCVPLICVTKHVSMFNIGGWYVFTFRLTIFSCFTWFYTNFSLCSYNLCFHSWKDSTNENFGLNHMLNTYMYTFRGNSFLPSLQFTTKLNKWTSTQRNRVQKMLDLTLNLQRMGLFWAQCKSVKLSWS